MIGPPGLERVVNAMRVIAPELPFPIEYRELREPEEKLEINGYHITAYRVNHNVTCYGYAIEIPRAGKFDVERAKELGLPVRLWNPLQKGKQVEWEGEIYTPDMVMGPARRGIKIAYCTDSRPTERIVTNARGADLFICEGMYAEKEKLAKARQYKHMTFYEAAQMAKEAEVSELWLTHFSPSLTNPRSYMGKCARFSRRPIWERTARRRRWILWKNKVFCGDIKVFAMEEREIRILAIESSCDETAAAVVCNGRDVRSNIISTQIPLHTLYGGVVPEIASRKHMERINQVITAALSEADTTLDDLDAVAVTYGPGLVGALLVGVAEAKAIAFARKLPLIGVHHIEGHISANYIENKDLKPPFLCLVVSGGHTHLVNVEDYGVYRILGRTRDDAAGEAFDRWPEPSVSAIPAAPKLSRRQRRGIPTPFPSPLPESRTRPTISASAV